jgi:hypothetical protein
MEADREDLKVYPTAYYKVIYVPVGRGEELRVHLASHNFQAQIRHGDGLEWLELRGDANTLQAILDEWDALGKQGSNPEKDGALGVASGTLTRSGRTSMSKNIYVGNLPLQATAADLSESFGAFGTVTRVHIVSDLAASPPRVFGFVEMADGADEAIEALDGAEYRGPALRVREASEEQAPDFARDAMEQRVPRHASGGPREIDRRLEELVQQDEPALEAEERCALKSLRGDFRAVPALTTSQDRAEVARFEGEGGRTPESQEESACDRNDRTAVDEALQAARR